MANVFIEKERLLDGEHIMLTIERSLSHEHISLDERTAELIFLALRSEFEPLHTYPPKFNIAVARAMKAFLKEGMVSEDSIGDLMNFVYWTEQYETIVG